MLRILGNRKPPLPSDAAKLQLLPYGTQKLSHSDGSTIEFATYGAINASCPTIFCSMLCQAAALLNVAGTSSAEILVRALLPSTDPAVERQH